MFLIKKEISQDKIKRHLSTYQTNGLTMKKKKYIYIYLIHQKAGLRAPSSKIVPFHYNVLPSRDSV